VTGRGLAISSAQRDEELRGAGFNILHLDPEAVALDFFSDAVDRSPVAEVARAEATAALEGAKPPDLPERFRSLCGDARLAFLTKGRAAEVALVDALGLHRPVILTHGLFSTTTRALARCEAVIEQVPTIDVRGTSDVDVDQLRARLAAAGTGAAVWLEVANNGLAGWPLSPNNVRCVRELCDERGARLLIDATRVMTNSALIGEDPLEGARRMLALADAFTISCAKEFVVPVGAVVGSRDAELIGRVNASSFSAGTSLDRAGAQAALAEGHRYVSAHPGVFSTRNDRSSRLAELLVRKNLSVVSPSGGHAVFVEIENAAMNGFDIPRLFSLLGHLYALGGVRGQILPRTGKRPLLRLALALERFADTDLEAAADGVSAFMKSVDRAPTLRAAAGQEHIAPLHRRFEVA
jgi:tryptophanase